MPKLWKEAIVVLVRNTSYPKTLNDLSGMNFYWKLSLLDPLQFAYQARSGVEDASSTQFTFFLEFKLELKIVGWLLK